jgi:hypothetical protein
VVDPFADFFVRESSASGLYEVVSPFAVALCNIFCGVSV